MKISTKLAYIFLALVAFDQLVKIVFISASLCNKNIAWNIPVHAGIFCFAWTIIIAVLIYIFLKTKTYSQKIFLLLIFSGAISNMIDRLRFGCVVDYIDIKIFPVFNLADVYITVGIISLLFVIAREQSDRSNPVPR